MKTADYWIRHLKLRPHPEGGFFREVYRSDETIPHAGLPERYSGQRAFSTSIYFLLRGNDVSKFHRLKSDELWYFHTGSALTIHTISPRGKYSCIKLGPGTKRHETFQCVIRKNNWFGATVDNPKGFSLVGCNVAPGFDFADFEMATREILLQLMPRKQALIRTLC